MANGDIALTTPRTAPNLRFSGFRYVPALDGELASAFIQFRDDLGKVFEVLVRNGLCVGFNASTGAAVQVTSASELTTLVSNVFKVGALTTEVTALRTAGIIVAPGTVG